VRLSCVNNKSICNAFVRLLSCWRYTK